MATSREGDHRPWHLLHPEVEGIEDLERPPRDGEVEWGITAEELRRRHYGRDGTLDEEAENHRRCWECGNRVTILPDGKGEAGHASGWRHPRCSQHQGDPMGDAEALPRTLEHRPVWEVFAPERGPMLLHREAAPTILDEVPGVGPETHKRLCREFGGVAGVREASAEELQTVFRVGEATATAIHEHLHADAEEDVADHAPRASISQKNRR